MYEYKAKITNVVDGDTYDFEISLGFGITYNGRLRLYGVDTPEVRGKEKARGRAVTNRVKSLIEGNNVLLKTHKWKGKYGRYIASVTVLGDKNGEYDLGEWLVATGMARKVDY